LNYSHTSCIYRCKFNHHAIPIRNIFFFCNWQFPNKTSLVYWAQLLILYEHRKSADFIEVIYLSFLSLDSWMLLPVANHWQTLSHNVVSRTGLELTTLAMIGTDCTGSCKSNYHTITTTTSPSVWCVHQSKGNNSKKLYYYEWHYKSVAFLSCLPTVIIL
jgi:hypothetical protein